MEGARIRPNDLRPRVGPTAIEEPLFFEQRHLIDGTRFRFGWSHSSSLENYILSISRWALRIEE